MGHPSRHDDDCPRCRRGEHDLCLEDPDVGSFCGCAEGGHL